VFLTCACQPKDQLAGLVEEEDEEVEDDEDEGLISPAASMTLEVAVMKENADMALMYAAA
jgi:hypothetical protein